MINEKLEVARTLEVLDNYSNNSTIPFAQHLHTKQSGIGITFWFTVFGVFLVLSVYWSLQMYMDWSRNQVSTSISSTAIPIAKLPFPGLVFCHEGFNLIGHVASIVAPILEKMNELSNNSFPFTPYEVSYNYVMLPEKVPPKELEEIETIMEKKQILKGTNIIQLVYPYTMIKQYYRADWVTWDFVFSVKKQALKVSNLVWFSVKNYVISSDALLTLFFSKNHKTITQDTKDFSLYIDPEQFNIVYELVLKNAFYSKLPCFDIQNLTAFSDNQNSFIKRCSWRGVDLPCSSIFDAVVTDSGICCGFNMRKTNHLFVESYFQRTITAITKRNKILSFKNATRPEWYVKRGEPIARSGSKSGLQVTLDGHNDYVDLLSIYKNFDSFTCLITPSDDFPLTNLGKFSIRKGFFTRIVLSGTTVQGDVSVEDIDPQTRGCLFPNELKLKLFKLYSQANCFFECWLRSAQRKANFTCTPWYFPHNDGTDLLCSSPLADNILSFFILQIQDELCFNVCLPNCNAVNYKWTMSMEPIRDCDDFNLLQSPLCNLKNVKPDVIPFHWFTDNMTFKNLNWEESKFRRPSLLPNPSEFTLDTKFLDNYDEYDAFKKDIAVVSIYFDKMTFVGFIIQPSSTWSLFFSNVGGVLGLTIGMGLASIVEIGWHLYRLALV